MLQLVAIVMADPAVDTSMAFTGGSGGDFEHRADVRHAQAAGGAED